MRAFLVALLACTAASSAWAQTPAPGDWPTYGRDPGGARFSPLTQITPANVTGLKPAWTYHMRPNQPALADGATAHAGPRPWRPDASPGPRPRPWWWQA